MSLTSTFLDDHSHRTQIYTLSLHDALPICHHVGDPAPAEMDITLGCHDRRRVGGVNTAQKVGTLDETAEWRRRQRSEEHTSELQSHSDLVCRLLLEKKNLKRLFP